MDRCSACPRVNTCVPPSGPRVKGGIMFVGEAPGKEENREGVPFVGKTGREVNDHYLPLAGLRRDSSYFTNAIKCLPASSDGKLDMNSKADKELLRVCAEHHLYEEIAELDPKLIVPMGAFACYALDPNINLELHHGLPYSTAIGFTSFPLWHPAGGIHEPKKMLQIRTDWIRLNRYLKGRLFVPRDQFPNPDYQEVESERELRDIDPTIPMANDTEYSRSLGPFCLTYSQQGGVGRLIRASRKDLISAFDKILLQWESDIWFHNHPYDSGVVREMGLHYPRKNIRDTILRIAHLANLPKGLKTVAFRELGVQMMDFEDLVHPYSRPRILSYYNTAYLEHDWEKPDPSFVLDPKTGKTKVYQPQSMKTKLKRFLGDVQRNPDKDIFQAWDNWESAQAEFETKVGPYPGVDIVHAAEDNWEAVLTYACRDADVTLRLVSVIDEMIEAVKEGKPQEMWRM